MAKVIINVEPGKQAYFLCYELSSLSQDIEIIANRWLQKDEVYDSLMKTSKFYQDLARQIAKQVSTVT